MRDAAKKHDHIIGKIENNYWNTYHKFTIRVPKKVDEALLIYKEMGTDFWRRLIEKEMFKVLYGCQGKKDRLRRRPERERFSLD